VAWNTDYQTPKNLWLDPEPTYPGANLPDNQPDEASPNDPDYVNEPESRWPRKDNQM